MEELAHVKLVKLVKSCKNGRDEARPDHCFVLSEIGMQEQFSGETLVRVVI